MKLDNTPIYVINILDKEESIEKTKILKDSLKDMGCFDNVHFLNTMTYGNVMDDDRLFMDIKTNSYNNDSTAFHQFGCFLSHYKTWKMLSESENDNAIIFEDDVIFKEDFVKDFNNIETPNDFDILLVGGTILTLDTSITGTYIPKFELWVNNIPNSHTTEAYILSKKGANKIINHLKNDTIKYLEDEYHGFLPVDWWLFYLGKLKMINYYAHNPNLIYQIPK